jgi:hypothetical protein
LLASMILSLSLRIRVATASSRGSPAALLAAELAALRAREAPDDVFAAVERLAAVDFFAVERLAALVRLAAVDFFAPVVRLAAVDFFAVEPLEDFFVERLAPDEPLLDEAEPDDPALLLGWGMVFSSYVDRKAPTAP